MNNPYDRDPYELDDDDMNQEESVFGGFNADQYIQDRIRNRGGLPPAPQPPVSDEYETPRTPRTRQPNIAPPRFPQQGYVAPDPNAAPRYVDPNQPVPLQGFDLPTPIAASDSQRRAADAVYSPGRARRAASQSARSSTLNSLSSAELRDDFDPVQRLGVTIFLIVMSIAALACVGSNAILFWWYIRR
jgi:hypothetical protein